MSSVGLGAFRLITTQLARYHVGNELQYIQDYFVEWYVSFFVTTHRVHLFALSGAFSSAVEGQFGRKCPSTVPHNPRAAPLRTKIATFWGWVSSYLLSQLPLYPIEAHDRDS